MSNVLIGIIGVILFIGLALAGALVLGDDFKESKLDAQAAQQISQLQQAAQAAAMYKLKSGREVYSTEVDFLIPRYLSTHPINVTVPEIRNDYKLIVHFTDSVSSGANESSPKPTTPAIYVKARLYGDNSTALCEKIKELTASNPNAGCSKGSIVKNAYYKL